MFRAAEENFVVPNLGLQKRILWCRIWSRGVKFGEINGSKFIWTNKNYSLHDLILEMITRVAATQAMRECRHVPYKLS